MNSSCTGSLKHPQTQVCLKTAGGALTLEVIAAMGAVCGVFV
jgi:hypothetical protein